MFHQSIQKLALGSGCKAVFSAYACPYSGVSEDIKPVDIKQELPMETFGSIVGESVESEASVANNVKPKVEGGPWMVSKCKAVEDPEFSIKAETWMKTEDLVKEEMKMECILPTESKSIWQQMKRVSKDWFVLHVSYFALHHSILALHHSIGIA